ncbi:MAG: hypothetical protein PHE33_12265 [Bacteroidales bacterium]|nr:hypothetical protein [Bacteroidales bacterium]
MAKHISRYCLIRNIETSGLVHPKRESFWNLSKYGLDDKITTIPKTAINKTKKVIVASEYLKINKTIDFDSIYLL